MAYISNNNVSDDPESPGAGIVTDGDERTPLLISQSASNYHQQQQPLRHHHFQYQQAPEAATQQQQPPLTPSLLSVSPDMQFSLQIQGDPGDLSIINNVSLDFASSSVSSGHCHSDETERHFRYVAAQKIARRRLLIASGACLVFMIGEVVGGAIANSLAIMTDAAHLLTDLTSFLISLLALYLATKKPSRRMSFGWYRAEVIGALISVIMIWLVTGVLVYIAIQRVVYGNYEVDGKPMLITAGVGVAFNAMMALLLHQGHGHSHKSAVEQTSSDRHHDHDQHHHHHPHHHRSTAETINNNLSEGNAGADSQRQSSHETKPDHVDEALPEPAEVELSDTTGIVERDSRRRRHGNRHVHDHPTGHHHGHEHEHVHVGSSFGHNHSHNNMNVRAAFIHVIGDLLQSIGVLVAAFIIYYRPDYKLADPICTFVFSLLVMGTTVNILRDTLRVLLEATPQGVDIAKFRSALADLPSVVQVHSLRVWSLTLGRNVASAHLAVRTDCGVARRDALVVMATDLAKKTFNFSDVTFQVEPHVVEMDSCEHCRSV